MCMSNLIQIATEQLWFTLEVALTLHTAIVLACLGRCFFMGGVQSIGDPP